MLFRRARFKLRGALKWKCDKSYCREYSFKREPPNVFQKVLVLTFTSSDQYVKIWFRWGDYHLNFICDLKDIISIGVVSFTFFTQVLNVKKGLVWRIKVKQKKTPKTEMSAGPEKSTVLYHKKNRKLFHFRKRNHILTNLFFF